MSPTSTAVTVTSVIVTTVNEVLHISVTPSSPIKTSLVGYPFTVYGMSELIYDPDGFQTNIFNIANLQGNLDGGTFN